MGGPDRKEVSDDAEWLLAILWQLETDGGADTPRNHPREGEAAKQLPGPLPSIPATAFRDPAVVDMAVKKDAVTSAAVSAFPTSPSANSTVPAASGVFGAVWGLLHRLADLLHMSPIGVIALLILILVVVSCVVAIVCIRRRNKQLGQKAKLKDDDFDDLPLPDFLDGADLGSFFFSLTYNVKSQTLKIGISHATGVRATGNEPLNVYVTAVLVEPLEVDEMLPDGNFVKRPPGSCSMFTSISKKVKTPIIENSRSPVFNTNLSLKASLDTALSKWILFEFYDYDPSGQDPKIGRIIVRLPDIEPSSFLGSVLEMERDIEACLQDDPNGDICLVMRYLSPSPSRDEGIIEFIVLEARLLPISVSMLRGSPRIRLGLTVYVDGKKVKNFVSKQHPLVSRSPYFNSHFRVSLNDADIRSEAVVKLSVFYMAPPLMLRKRVGVFRVGKNVDNLSGKIHWSEMLKNPLRPIARWHGLQ